MQFVDQVDITVKAGDGGNGLVAFRHEKYVPRGGASGGNGGHGGSVVFKAVKKLNTLVDLRYKKNYKADRGGDGGPNNMYGKSAKNLVLEVPVGTMILDAETGGLLADLVEDGQKYEAAKGGEGGRGNASFVSSSLQTPKFAEKGEPTDPIALRLELRLLADVGLVGYPNVGKSTLISRISSARPKIANYAFTTLVPNLGVVKVGDDSFVVADMPGLIEGAHEGIGLGHQFLRHIERTRLLVHMIDVSGYSGRDASMDFDAINDEIKAHSERLTSLPQIIALNKADMPESAEIVKKIKLDLEKRGYQVFEISALTGMGVQPLLYKVSEMLDSIPKEETPVNKIVRYSVDKVESTWDVRKAADHEFVVEGHQAEMLVLRTDTTNEYALRRLQRQLDKLGVIKRLRELGAEHGDTVRVRDLEFYFHDEAYE